MKYTAEVLEINKVMNTVAHCTLQSLQEVYDEDIKGKIWEEDENHHLGTFILNALTLALSDFIKHTINPNEQDKLLEMIVKQVKMHIAIADDPKEKQQEAIEKFVKENANE